MSKHIAFIGLGNMGGPMAANLVKAGHQVKAFDLSQPACQVAREHGVEVAVSVAEATEGAGTVISMLPASKHVESLYLSEDGVLALLAADALAAATRRGSPEAPREPCRPTSATALLITMTTRAVAVAFFQPVN